MTSGIEPDSIHLLAIALLASNCQILTGTKRLCGDKFFNIVKEYSVIPAHSTQVILCA